MRIFLLVLVAFLIRLYHHHHILMSDEANNMLTIKAVIEGDGFREYFFKHPPLFTIFSSAISYPFGHDHHIVQGISILFSLLSFIPLYLVACRLFDKRTALLSLLFLAVMPLNIFYSTWIKQDAMLMFFFLFSLYLYIADRPYLSGFMLGIASLTKEFAWFLLPIVIGWELLKGWEAKNSPRRIFTWMVLGCLVSGWWYLFFGGISYRAIGAVASGGNMFEFAWHYPWHYYMRNLRADLTLTLSFFLLAGLPTAVKGLKAMPLVWVLSFYVPLSFMKVKAPWYTFLASPAMAIICASGFLKIWGMRNERWLRWSIAALAAFLVSYNLYVFNGHIYYKWLLRRNLPVFYEQEYLSKGREILSGEKKVALLRYNPTLQYYLDIPDKRLFYLGSQFPAMDREMLIELVGKNDVGWFAIDADLTNYVAKNISDLTYLYGDPKQVGNILIFKAVKGNIP